MNTSANKWYRQPVIWLFLGLLGTTVVGCIAMIVVAVKSNDGLVADDYYKRGNEIGKDIARDRMAAKLGVTAKVIVSEDGVGAHILLVPMPVKANPLSLRLSHPTRPGQDQAVILRAGEDGMLHGKLARPLVSQRWLLVLDDELGGWSLRGEGVLGAGLAVDLRPNKP
ncbi:FixH family protein [Chitinimonas arctica]|uniref:FixH family protein n=1 Tax=Chitinimonas arctica TaxID=2594795 RepID=A0A516SCI5_9NEIS|nr:FixH family protein [Chitinimonas arctica]QDQ25768.1 FixH family protein [Chitinimonas arctica]